MGNVYHITRCPHCGRIMEPTDFNCIYCPACNRQIVQPQVIMVHRSDNWDRAEKLLESGMSLTEVDRHFCNDCGGHQDPDQPCTCMVDIRAGNTQALLDAINEE